MSDASNPVPEDSQPTRPPSSSVPLDGDVQRRMRQIGLGLIVAAVVVDIGWSQLQRVRTRYRTVAFQLQRRIDPPGPILLAAGISLLESTTDREHA